MSDGVEHCPAIYWRLNGARYRMIGKIFPSSRVDLKDRPVDLGYVPGEGEERLEDPTNVTVFLGKLASLVSAGE